jgi:putative FmdB family regulatory protein
MPTYEYECPEGHTFERFQKMTDKPRAAPCLRPRGCPQDFGWRGAGVQGSGFYITDYGKDGKAPQGRADG